MAHVPVPTQPASAPTRPQYDISPLRPLALAALAHHNLPMQQILLQNPMETLQLGESHSGTIEKNLTEKLTCLFTMPC